MLYTLSSAMLTKAMVLDLLLAPGADRTLLSAPGESAMER